MSFNYFERVIRFISTHLDYCNGLYVGINQAGLPNTFADGTECCWNAQARTYYTNIGFRSLAFMLELILRF